MGIERNPFSLFGEILPWTKNLFSMIQMGSCGINSEVYSLKAEKENIMVYINVRTSNFGPQTEGLQVRFLKNSLALSCTGRI